MFVGLDGAVTGRAALAACAVAAVAAASLGLASAAGASTFAPLDATPEPLQSTEWWLADVGVAGLTPPGPGIPLTLVDTGIFFGHQEFVGRPDLVALNPQEPAPLGGVHGTAVASVAGATANGIGLLGLYPTVAIRSYDASLGDGTQLPASEIAAGIRAAAAGGPTVINLSLGGNLDDPAIDAAVTQAVRSGSLVVAASGNSGDAGNPLTYPAATPHVLTVAATDQNDQVAPFSSQSNFVDLSAPGVDIPVASALDNSYAVESGTSFASPMVAAAAAWLWTVRPTLDASQVAEILRRSARDIGASGYDVGSGYGILNVAAALAAPTPLSDPAEPNDTLTTARSVTTQQQPTGTASGRVAAYDDPRDDLRVFVPKGKRLTVTATADSNVAFTLETGAATTLARAPHSAGRTTSLTYRNVGAGRTAYVSVTPAGVRTSDYTLTFSVR
ncbi:MAG: thermitase [Gaiellaceae bacterium]|nr:thermitase [Gaiellaceae bacterium]